MLNESGQFESEEAAVEWSGHLQRHRVVAYTVDGDEVEIADNLRLPEANDMARKLHALFVDWSEAGRVKAD